MVADEECESDKISPNTQPSSTKSFLFFQKTLTNPSCHLAGIATPFKIFKNLIREGEAAGFACLIDKSDSIECVTVQVKQ